MAPPLPAGCMFLVLALITDVMFDEVRNVTVKDAVILSNLSYQDLANLGLRDVPQAVPRGTEALLFSGNNVTSLSGQFWTRGCQKGVTTAGCSLLPYIAVLDLSNNLIETTDRHCFGGMERLHLLLLQNNRLRTIGPDTFADKRLLIWLDMSGNRISYLHPETFQGSKNLQHLFLNCNVIRDIHVDTFRGLGQLRQMSLEDNNISVVDAHLFRDLINLYALKLDFNYLSYIPGTIFLHLRKLQIFSASHNIIWSFSSMFFPSARNLRSVDLSHNSIRHLSRYDFQNLEEIAHVNFSYNNLKSLYLSRIPVARIVTSSTNWLIRNTSLCTGSNGNFPCFFPRNNLETDKVFHSVDFSYNKVSKIIFVISDSSHTLVIIKISLAGNRGFFFPVSFIRQERYITALDLNQTNLSWRNMTLFDEILQLPHLKSLSISGSEACGHHMKQVLMSIFNHNYRVHLNCDGFPPPTGTDLYAAQPDSLDNSSYGLANNGNCNSTPEENGWSEVDGDSGYFPCQYFESFTTITVDFIGMNYDIFCGYAVDCSYVSLSTLPRINSSVDCILLSHNELTFLEPGFFPNFHDLWYLDLSFNGLTSLGEGVFERLVNLVFLNLNGNQLSSLSSHAFEDLVHLTMLTMHGNRISSYDPDTFGNQARLRLLSVDFRNLTRFHEGTLRNLPALQVLELRETCELATSRHLLGAVHFKSLRSLKSCRITGFLINSSSPGDLFEASALDLLEIKDSSLPVITGDSFEKLKGIQILILARSNITILRGSFENLDQLTVLDFSQNDIEFVHTGFFPKMGQLQYLNMSHNRVACVALKIFESMPALKVIDLSYNFIVRLAWDVISQLLSLEKLILSENLITVSDNLHNRQSYNSCRNSSVNIISPFSVQTDINRSEYRYNVCDSANNSFDVNIFGKSKLVTLSLEWNCLATLVGNVFTNSSSSLQHVRFTHNRIREIGNKAFANTVNLKLLDLSYNSLSVINNYTFRSLTQLVLLNLEHNELELIEEGAFHNLNSLLSLAIAFNKLKTFNFNTFPQENSLIAFSAHNNPLVSLETTIHLTHLTTLNVSNSLLMAGLKVFDSMPSLHVLDVSNTSLCEIGVESFRNTNHLHHLTLGSSCLRGLACSHFDSLNRLLFLRFSIEEPDANALDTHISWKNLTLIKRLVRKTLPGVPCPHWTSHMPGSAKGADYRELISFGHVEMGYLLVLIGPAKHDRVTRWHVHGGCFFTLRLLPRGLFLKRNHIESGSIWTSLKSVSHIKTHAVYTFNAFA